MAIQEFNPSEQDEERECTPFMYAVAFGYTDTVKAMLASGRIDLNLTDGCGTSALSMALTKGYIEDIAKDILETLTLEKQVDEKNTALMCAAACNASKVLSRILTHNNSKEYIDRKNSKGFTVLMFAVINNDSNIVNKLLASEADPSIINNNGEDAFIIASKKGYLGIVEMLKPKEPTVLKKCSKSNLV